MSEYKESKETLREAALGLCEVIPGVHECDIIDAVCKYAKCSSATACGTGWIRGVGATIATSVSSGFVIAMLCRINTIINLKLSKDDVKSVALSIIQGVLPTTAAALITCTGTSFIPIIGRVISLAALTPICYNTTLSSGVIYIKAIKDLVIKNGSVEDITCTALQQII